MSVLRGVKRVVVGVSGGVDSSVTAYLLKKQGWDVLGIHMRNWDASDEVGGEVCTNDEDRKSAERVCQEIGIPLKHMDFVGEYWSNVFVPFLESYQLSHTPNPDAWCNREIKFGAFMEKALEHGDMLATGHYARVSHEHADHPLLYTGLDRSKDQSYFLSCVHQERLAKAMFPLGDVEKSRVRRIAEEAGLSTAGRKDSYGICFIGKRSLKNFLPEYIRMTPGDFVCVDSGRVLGRHSGCELFTEGQNARVSGQSAKYFVAGKDPKSGIVRVAKGPMHPALFCSSCEASSSSFNWITLPSRLGGLDIEPGVQFDCLYRIRHRQETMGHARVEVGSEKIIVRFSKPQRAVSTGQIIAFYEPTTGQCFGGGKIGSAGPSLSELEVDTPSDVSL